MVIRRTFLEVILPASRSGPSFRRASVLLYSLGGQQFNTRRVSKEFYSLKTALKSNRTKSKIEKKGKHFQQAVSYYAFKLFPIKSPRYRSLFLHEVLRHAIFSIEKYEEKLIQNPYIAHLN